MRKFFKGKRVIACLTATTMMLSAVSSVFATDNILEDNLVVGEDVNVEMMFNYDADEAPLHPSGRGYTFDYTTKTLYIDDATYYSNSTSGSEVRYGWYACAINTDYPTLDDNTYHKLGGNIVRICDVTEHIVIEEGVTEIGNYVFQHKERFPKLKSLSLPSTLTTIDCHSFDSFDFDALGVDMNVFSNIETIDNYGFIGCTFGDVTFDSLTTAGVGAFNAITANSLELGANFTFAQNKLFANAEITGGHFALPDTVSYIGAYAFSMTVENFYLAKNVREIGPSAFANCDITNFHMYDDAVYIRDFAFTDSPSDVWYHGLKTEAIKNIDYQNSWNNDYFRNDATWHYEEIKADDIEDQYFYGSPIEPELTVKHVFLDDNTEKTLTKGTDYTVSYENNDKVGTAVATITGIGDYEGEVSTLSFNILNGMASGFSISNISSVYYTGEEQMPTPTVKNNGVTLSEGTDYTLSYANNINAGTATVTVTGMGKYTGSKSKDFKINPYGIANVNISSIPTQNYTGNEIEVYPEVTFGDDILLQEGVDYDVEFANNKAVGNASVKITGKGNFVGSKIVSFKIRSTSSGTWDGPELYYRYGYAPSYYDTILNEITLTAPDGTVFYGLNPNVDDEDEAKEIGNIELRHYRYNSDEDTDEYIGEIYDIYSDSDGPMGVRVGDSIVAYVTEFNWENINTDYGFPSGMANSTGRYYTMTVLPNKESISNFNILASQNGIDFDGPEYLNCEYTGKPIEPEFELDISLGTGSVGVLSEDKDFITFFEDNVNAGTATVTIMGLGESVVGTRTTTFEISQADIANATAETLPDVDWTGFALEPKPTLTYNGLTLYEGTDYTLSYDNNTDAATSSTDTAKVIVTGIGNFTGTQTIEFLIVPEDIENKAEGFVNGYYMYKGTAVEPTDITAYYNGKELVMGEDFEIVSYANNNAVGTGTVTLNGIGNYCGYFTADFTINEYKPWLESGIDIDGNISYEAGNTFYTGSEVEPSKLVITYRYVDPATNTSKTYTLVEDEDYMINGYNNNINASNASRGCATAMIKGLGTSEGGFYGTVDCDYTINPMAIDATIGWKTSTTAEDVPYTGSTALPNLELSYNGIELVEGTDYYFNYLDAPVNVGEYTLQVCGQGNFDSSINVTYNVTAIDFSQVEAKYPSHISFDDLVEEPTTFIVTYNGKTLTLGTDYEVVSWANNTKIGTATATLKGIGNFAGTKEVPFDIKEDLSDATGYVNETCVYEGAPVEPTNIVLEHNGLEGVTLVEGRDYEITSYANNNAVGTGTVTLTGLGYFEGTKTIQFEIKELTPPDVEIDINDTNITFNETYTYDGTAKEPIPTIVYKFEGENGYTNDIVLVEGENFEITGYENNVNAGTATVTVTGKGENVTGTKPVTFTINPMDIVDLDTVELDEPTLPYCDDIMATPYATLMRGNVELVEGTDYEMRWDNTVNPEGFIDASSPHQPVLVGTYSVIIEGKGNYTGSVALDVEITPVDIVDATVTLDPNYSYVYDGSAKTPDISVDYSFNHGGGWTTTLTPDKDYTVSYSDNTEAGTATVLITGIGNYTGTKTVEFEILSSLDTAVESAEVNGTYTYTGSAIEPTDVTIIVDGNTLEKDVDFEITGYENNVNAGTAKILIKGKGQYSGSITVEFTISPMDSSQITIAPVANQKYTGQPIMPDIKATR